MCLVISSAINALDMPTKLADVSLAKASLAELTSCQTTLSHDSKRWLERLKMVAMKSELIVLLGESVIQTHMILLTFRVMSRTQNLALMKLMENDAISLYLQNETKLRSYTVTI